MTANDFLLSLFTGDDDLRPAMKVPNLHNGKVSATDTLMIIEIPAEEVHLKYDDNEKFPSTEKIIKDFEDAQNPSVKVRTADLALALAKARKSVDFRERCKKCNGTGNAECPCCGNYADCKECDGEGFVENKKLFPRVKFEYDDNENPAIFVGDIKFHSYNIYRIYMVALTHGFEEIEIFYNNPKGGTTMMYFGNIKVVAMTMKYD